MAGTVVEGAADEVELENGNVPECTPEVVAGGAVDVGGAEVGVPVEAGGAVVGGPVGCTEVGGIDEAGGIDETGSDVLEAGAVGAGVVASVGAVAAGVDDTPEVGGAEAPVAENASCWP